MTKNNMDNSFKVAVLFGGKSTEHEISVVSAMQVIRFLKARHEVIPIYITREGQWFTGDILSEINAFKDIDTSIKTCSSLAITPDSLTKTIENPLGKGFLNKPRQIDIDVVFPVLHGLHGEDGTVQGLLELADIPYVGSGVLASAIGIDKDVTKRFLLSNGVPVLNWLVFSRREWMPDEKAIMKIIEEKYQYPVIVKPADLGSSIGVNVVDNFDDLSAALSSAMYLDSKVIVEPYLENIIEVNCSVLGNDQPISSTTEQPLKFGDLLSFEDKYIHKNQERGMDGAKRIIPAPVSESQNEEIRNLAIRTFQVLGCKGVARVDFLVDTKTGDIFVNEINTLPGSIAYYLWKEAPYRITPEQLVDEIN